MAEDSLAQTWSGLMDMPIAAGKGLEGTWDNLKSGTASQKLDLSGRQVQLPSAPIRRPETARAPAAAEGAASPVAGHAERDAALAAKAKAQAEPAALSPAGIRHTVEELGGAAADVAGAVTGTSPRAEAELKTEMPAPPSRHEALRQKPDQAVDIALGFGILPLGSAGKYVEKLFSPTTVDASSQFAESGIRAARGEAERETATAIASLEQYRKLTTPFMPEFEQHIRDIHAGNPTPTPSRNMDFIDYVEGRSGGAKLAGPPELQDLADQTRKLMQERAAAIKAEPTTSGTALWDDYLSHVWKEKGPQPGGLQAGGAIGQGSGKPLKSRSIPTIRDGIAAGLTPASLDPIETTLRYVENMDKYLAANRVFREGRDGGMIKWFRPGGKVPDGWVPLQGRLAGPKAAGKSGGIIQAYAPEGFARVYNNSIAPGLASGELGGPIYQGLLHAKNATISALLGLSGFHAMAETENVVASGIARAIGNISDGDFRLAAQNAGLSAMVVPKVAEQLAMGSKFTKQYLRQADYGPNFEKIVGLGAKAGMRAVGRGAEYRSSMRENWAKAWKRGTLGFELKHGLQDIAYGGPMPTAPLRAAKMFGQSLARTMDTVSAPLFDYAIPRLKNAAFYDEMQDWLRAHPMAAGEEQAAHARRIWDSIDDRYGEMVMDNLFWNKSMKQALMLSTVSLGWELGTARAFGGSAVDAARFLKSGELSPRLRFGMALPVSMGILNTAYQYLKTGTTALDSDTPGKDLIAPRTGATTKTGVPEPAIGPGYEKDILGYWQSGIGHLGSVNPMVRLIGQGINVARGGELSDYAGRPVVPRWQAGHGATHGQPSWYPKELPNLPPWVWAYTDHVLGQVAPIGLQQQLRKQPGTAISGAETAMGIREAPQWLEDPAKVARLQKAHELSELRKARSSLKHSPAQSIIDPQRRHVSPVGP